jgi:hypothetical protein
MNECDTAAALWQIAHEMRVFINWFAILAILGAFSAHVGRRE